MGRDFDQVRSIVWKGNPGKAMADLIAGALAEKGIAAVRVAGEAEIPSGVPARVWGSVEEFRVNFKRVGTLKVEAEAGTTLKIHGAGPAAPAGGGGTAAPRPPPPFPSPPLPGSLGKNVRGRPSPAHREVGAGGESRGLPVPVPARGVGRVGASRQRSGVRFPGRGGGGGGGRGGLGGSPA